MTSGSLDLLGAHLLEPKPQLLALWRARRVRTSPARSRAAADGKGPERRTFGSDCRLGSSVCDVRLVRGPGLGRGRRCGSRTRGWSGTSSRAPQAPLLGTRARARVTPTHRVGLSAHLPRGRRYRETRAAGERLCAESGGVRSTGCEAYFAGERCRLRRRRARTRRLDHVPAGRDACAAACPVRRGRLLLRPRADRRPSARAARCRHLLRAQPVRNRRPVPPRRRRRRPRLVRLARASTTSNDCSRSKVSLSEDLRHELAAITPRSECDRLAELSGLFHSAGSVHLRGPR